MIGFNLIYHHRVTGKIVLVKRVTSEDYHMIDPATGKKEKLTRQGLSKQYRSDPANKVTARRTAVRTSGRMRGVRTNSSELQSYLQAESA